MTVVLRDARRGDVADLLRLIRDLARYEKAEDQVKADAQQLAATLFGEGATAHAMVAEQDGLIVGLAIYFFNYSTWQGRNGLYLEDLFVEPEQRGAGIGKALLARLAALAVERDCGRFEWSVLDWNTPAIDFYEGLGARPQSEWVRYRLEGDALKALANSA
ncbi:GCN5 family acetyltransferase [Alcanivorax sp. HI0083]|uniref:GNAT family N-acetyltransferase n=1 Tax=unclassified Alcanivorax TaxID=2638842 RepID=UPI0007B98164|nr:MULTISPECIES: GNAT family N-acetyltransferase [unclassified Alcanivorax]KZY36172.1 GCN5 family acetyltransferase [Alcanivorax sp. HI0044]KZZ27529.1 GCN5 family acetyltransferase [Alcanivorax sp. HI0083]